MNQEADKPTDTSSGQITPIELAQLAVAVARWRRKDQPAFAEAEEIIQGARRHLSGDRQIENSPEGYFEELRRQGVNHSQITPQKSASLRPEVYDIVQTLMSGKSHPEIAEPQTFPAPLILCLRLITNEKDPRRRAPWLARADVREEGPKVSDASVFRIIAAKIVPHLPRFGAVYPKRKRAAAPRDSFGKFTKAGIQRDARGRAKSITDRDERGRILKSRA